MSQPRPRFLARLGLGLLVAAALLGGAEVALRTALGPPPPPVRVYSALGDHEQYLVAEGDRIATPYIDNDPPSIPLEVAGPRCAVIGGSTVHGGSGLKASAEFPALVEAQVGFPVVNLGFPGLDSFDLVRVVEDMLPFRWSCLVIYGPHNDFANALFQDRYGSVLGAAGAHATAWLGHFQLFAQVGRAVRGVSGGERKRPDGNYLAGLDEARHAEAVHYLEANHRRMVWLARQAGIRVVMVSPVADMFMKPPGTCEGDDCALVSYQAALRVADTDPARAAHLLREARDRDRVSLRAPTVATERLRAVAREEGAAWVDAEALLPHHPTVPLPARSLFTDPVHLTAEGHRAMADVLVLPVTQAAHGR